MAFVSVGTDMTLLVPFDGSSLSETALERAVRFGDLTSEDVLAVTVIPGEPSYAREHGWLDPDEQFDPDRIADRFERQVGLLAPEARFEAVRPVDVEGSTVTMDVIRTIRRTASDVDASILFVGSENVGRVTGPLASVGDPLAADQQYDVHIVRHPDGGDHGSSA